MKKIIGIFFLFLLSLTAQEKRYEGLVCYRFLGVIDTDSFVCNIIKPYPNTLLHPLMREGMGIRIRGIRVADINAKRRKERKLALHTQEFLKTYLPAAQSIRLQNVGRDVTFKLLADVYVDDQNLKTLLLEARLVCAEADTEHIKRFKIKKFIKKKKGLVCPEKPKPKKSRKSTRLKKQK